DVTNLALLLHGNHRIESLAERNAAVLVPPEVTNVDAFESKATEIFVAALLELLWAERGGPSCVGSPPPTELRRDRESLGIRVEHFRDESVRDERSVEPRRVDEVDAQVDDAPQHRPGPVGIAWLAENHGPRDLHRAKSEALHVDVTKP